MAGDLHFRPTFSYKTIVTFTDYTGHMAKRSSPFLRYAVMQAAMMVCLHEPRFAEIYQRKLKEGKAPLVARSHVAKRLLRIVWALETRGLAFDPSKI